MSTENPTVNRWLEDKAMDHIDHAIGRPVWPLREGHRNYFAIDVDSDLAATFDASPHWHLNGISGRMAYFAVTSAGKQALADYLANQKDRHQPFVVFFEGFSTIVPARSPGAAKYAYYLQVSDSWSELSFSEFVRQATVRRAA